MYILQLRKEMFRAIFSGKKTSTSRQGIRPIVPQQELRLIAPNESVSVDVLVTSVSQCKFDELTIKEAIKEGYSSLEELKDTLKKIYDIEKDDNFTIIEFKLPWDIDSINENVEDDNKNGYNYKNTTVSSNNCLNSFVGVWCD